MRMIDHKIRVVCRSPDLRLWCQPGVFTVELCERGDPGIKLFRASFICTRFSCFFIPGVCPNSFCCWVPMGKTPGGQQKLQIQTFIVS